MSVISFDFSISVALPSVKAVSVEAHAWSRSEDRVERILSILWKMLVGLFALEATAYEPIAQCRRTRISRLAL
jgi:hypothetical protein